MTDVGGFLIIEKQEPLVHVAFRLSPQIREQAKTLAQKKGVKEGAIYRAIVAHFFSANRQLSEDKSETNS